MSHGIKGIKNLGTVSSLKQIPNYLLIPKLCAKESALFHFFLLLQLKLSKIHYILNREMKIFPNTCFSFKNGFIPGIFLDSKFPSIQYEFQKIQIAQNFGSYLLVEIVLFL